MITRQYRPSWLRRLILPAVTAVFLGYFGYHAVNGEYGMVGRARFESRTQELNAELARLNAEKAALDAHVRLLRPSSLDQDMVDELLHLDGDDEFTIFLAAVGKKVEKK